MSDKTIAQTYWCKLEAGRYGKQVGPVLFTIEYDDEAKGWLCLRNGVVFDKAPTLREAKGYCLEPKEGA